MSEGNILHTPRRGRPPKMESPASAAPVEAIVPSQGMANPRGNLTAIELTRGYVPLAEFEIYDVGTRAWRLPVPLERMRVASGATIRLPHGEAVSVTRRGAAVLSEQE